MIAKNGLFLKNFRLLNVIDMEQKQVCAMIEVE